MRIVNYFYLLVIFAAIVIPAQGRAKDAATPELAKSPSKFHFGLKLGADFTHYKGPEIYSGQGVAGGLFGEFRKRSIGIKGEAMLSVVKYKEVEMGKITGLQIPVFFECQVVHGVWLQAGPQFTTNLSSPPASNYSDFNLKPYLSGALGVEVRCPAKILFGIRYLKGITDGYKGGYTDFLGNPIGTYTGTASTVHLYVGYAIR